MDSEILHPGEQVRRKMDGQVATVVRDLGGAGRIRVELDGKERTWSRNSVTRAHREERPVTHATLVAEPSRERPKHSPVVKAIPVRSRTYLDFVRVKSCVGCLAPGPSEAHHWGGRSGTGTKTDDLRTVPLCRGCHGEWHQKAKLGGLDTETTKSVFLRTQVDLLIEFFGGRQV